MYILAYTGIGLSTLVYVVLGLVALGIGLVRWSRSRRR